MTNFLCCAIVSPLTLQVLEAVQVHLWWVGTRLITRFQRFCSLLHMRQLFFEGAPEHCSCQHPQPPSFLRSSHPPPVPLVRPTTRPAAGNNEQQQKVEMTAPVTVRVIPSQGPFCEDNFQISFFVPFAVS